MSILIISYYNRPQDSLSADLLRYAAQHNFAIVLGDFNARHTDFGDTLTNPNGRLLNSLLTTLPLCRLHNTDPTFLSHSGCSITDHILSTENFVPFLYPHCSIGTTVTSDHVPLKTHFPARGLHQRRSQRRLKRPTPRPLVNPNRSAPAKQVTQNKPPAENKIRPIIIRDAAK
jgi:hypothetical protein